MNGEVSTISTSNPAFRAQQKYLQVYVSDILLIVQGTV
jgi:hypothetical protein